VFSTEEFFGNELWPLSGFDSQWPMSGDAEVVCAPDSQHLDSDQYGREDNCMGTVYRQPIECLKPW
jgi:hypothetical protein